MIQEDYSIVCNRSNLWMIQEDYRIVCNRSNLWMIQEDYRIVCNRSNLWMIQEDYRIVCNRSNLWMIQEDYRIVCNRSNLWMIQEDYRIVCNRFQGSLTIFLSISNNIIDKTLCKCSTAFMCIWKMTYFQLNYNYSTKIIQVFVHIVLISCNFIG